MKSKDAEKLFALAYTDSMTGANNRTAYDEELEKLRRKSTRLNNITVMIASLNGLKNINSTYGQRTGDEAVKAAASCIMRTVGTKADVYRIDGDVFVCIAEKDVLSYVSELRDLVSFEAKEKIYPFSLSIGYERFDGKKHKSIDELIIAADKRMCNDKKKERKMR